MHTYYGVKYAFCFIVLRNILIKSKKSSGKMAYHHFFTIPHIWCTLWGCGTLTKSGSRYHCVYCCYFLIANLLIPLDIKNPPKTTIKRSTVFIYILEKIFTASVCKLLRRSPSLITSSALK